MTNRNLYNKGTYRSYEYGKIPPYMKKLGNRKWRSNTQKELEKELSLKTVACVHLQKKKSKRNQRTNVKITLLDQSNK
ncbi:hypothetical protein V3470_13290 [Flavobacterium oreochromis]|uniref:hypothetical protein n=1 Tax=Flavobacterium oreochromis TaxID=2906078 RepID=UPI000B4D81C3|nr:hypothetical protein [Flavobacterium oreochromis]OWP75758.1 hypothetical protein BWG23_09870 [Flavobacterium oreochromis]